MNKNLLKIKLHPGVYQKIQKIQKIQALEKRYQNKETIED